MANRMFDNLIPYTDIHEMNLDWIIAKVKEYIEKYVDLNKFVNESIENQNKLIEQALKEISDGMQEITDYITENLAIIANEIINRLIESGEFYVGTEYDAETEELNIVLSKEE